MGTEFLFFLAAGLLPVAAFTGWLLGRRSKARDGDCPRDALSADYFKGLNYLLNEQPDKAIEVFVRLLEVDSETVDTHLALGNLFRRRGEVDRAIRIHQNLIARPTLERSQRHQALYELACDYLKAGLLDRAESLFRELADDPEFGQRALGELLEIYQQEKEWDRAIATAQRLAAGKGRTLGPLIAQFQCEQAEAEWGRGEQSTAMRSIRRALAADNRCVRATLLEGEIALATGAFRTAIRVLKRVEEQDPDYLPEVVEPLRSAYRQAGRPLEMLNYLREVLRRHEDISLTLALVELLRQQQGEREAAAALAGALRAHPSVRGMAHLIDLRLASQQPPSRDDLLVLKGLIDELLEARPRYRCQSCGFGGRQLHWQCPRCKQWSTTKPIRGVETEMRAAAPPPPALPTK